MAISIVLGGCVLSSHRRDRLVRIFFYGHVSRKNIFSDAVTLCRVAIVYLCLFLADWSKILTEHGAVVGWLLKFSKTAEGETTSEEAIAVLLDAQVKGCVLDVQTNKTILVKKKQLGKTYLRSNAEALRFGKILSGRAAVMRHEMQTQRRLSRPISRDAF